MLAARLHPRAGDRPRLALDFIPLGTDHLAGTRRRQDGKFQSPRRNARLPAEIGEEPGHFCIGQRRVMLDRGEARPPRRISPVRIPRTVAQSSTASIRP